MNASSLRTAAPASLAWLDLRSLALFRIVLSLLLLASTLARLPDLVRFDTDAGFFPRHAVSALSYGWSLHMASGTLLWSFALWALTLGAVLALLLGWRSRTAAAVAAVLWFSAMGRHPALVTAADALSLGWLCWAILLPTGACYGLDAARRAAPTAAGWQGAAVLGVRLYTLMVVASGVGLRLLPLETLAALPLVLGSGFWQRWKHLWPARRAATLYTDPQWGGDHTARLLRMFLLIDLPIRAGREHPRIWSLMQTHRRAVVIDAEDRAHWGWAGLVALVESSPFFHPLAVVLRWPWLARLGEAFIARPRPAAPEAVVSEQPVTGGGRLCTAMLLLPGLLAAGLHAAGQPSPLGLLGAGLGLPAMVAPPAVPKGWLVAQGVTDSGALVDALRPGQAIALAATPPQADMFTGRAGHALRARLMATSAPALRRVFAEALCRRSNRTAAPGQRLQSFQLLLLTAGPEATREQQVLWTQSCTPAD